MAHLSRRATVVLMAAVAGCVALAYSISVKEPTQPLFSCTFPSDIGGVASMSYKNCVSLYQRALDKYQAATWWRQTPFDLGEGLVVASALVVLLQRAKLPDGPRARGRLRRYLLLCGAVVFGSMFIGLAFISHLSWYLWTDWHSTMALTVHWETFSWLSFGLPQHPETLGALSFIYFVATCAFVTLLYGFRSTVFKFAMPIVLALVLCLMVLDEPEMATHATMFLSAASYDGFYLVSNWCLLPISGLVTIEGIKSRTRH